MKLNVIQSHQSSETSPRPTACEALHLQFWKDAKFELIEGYPGLVGSGTLTPDCFIGCIREDDDYVRIQPVLRPLDARGPDARLHLGLFTQIQIFSHRGPEFVAELLMQYLDVITGGGLPVTSEPSQWNAVSLGAVGIGQEVFLNGIEVAQINLISRMGGVSLPKQASLIAIGLERIQLALGAKMSSFPDSCFVPGSLSVGSLLSHFDAGAQCVSHCEALLDSLSDSAIPPEDALSVLADAQADVDLAYATGAITASYRSHFLRTFRRNYQSIGSKLLSDVPKDHRFHRQSYAPYWTVRRVVEEFASQAGSNAPIPLSEQKRTDTSAFATLTNSQLVSESHFLDPNCRPSVSAALVTNEFHDVLECEWRRSPDSQFEISLRTRTETGVGHLRSGRHSRIAAQLLKEIGAFDATSQDVLNRCNKLALLQETSFSVKITPPLADLSFRSYLTHWGADALDLALLTTRSRVRDRHSSLEGEHIAALCHAFVEIAETILVRVGLYQLPFSSSEDPGQIKRLCTRLSRIARAAGIAGNNALSVYASIGAYLLIPGNCIEEVFDHTFIAFSGGVS